MKHILLLSLLFVFVGALFANTEAAPADRILGTYRAVQEGKVSNVRFTKLADGGYTAQVVWLEKPNNPDGTPRTDRKNPDKAKRNVRSDSVVLIEKVTYDHGAWKNGRIYDPTKGKTFNVEITFKDDKTLAVKGSLLMFSKTVYWTKLDEK